jgi:hypothetical protein
VSRLKEKALITLARKGEESQPPRLVRTVYLRFVSLVTFRPRSPFQPGQDVATALPRAVAAAN